MNRIIKLLFIFINVAAFNSAMAQSNLPPCIDVDNKNWNSCVGSIINSNGDVYFGEFSKGIPNGQGRYEYANGAKYFGEIKFSKRHGKGISIYSDGDSYIGEYKDNNRNGKGTLIYSNGDKYIGEFKDELKHGDGILFYIDGRVPLQGEWKYAKFVRSANVNLQSAANQFQIENQFKYLMNDIAVQKKEPVLEEKKFVAAKIEKKESINEKSELIVNSSNPDSDGVFTIDVLIKAEIASLKINGREEGGRENGKYSIKRVAKIGIDNQYEIEAMDIYGGRYKKTISVTREVVANSAVVYAELNPALVKIQASKDAVAVVIGIANYKNLPRADYANEDALVFYDYAIRGLGIKPENIKLLVDADAGQGEILKAFKTWLPARVKATTDVYVYYSGHGLPSADGQTLYLLPQQADRDLIEDTAVAQSRINAAIQAAKPKSVTIFLDSCYSGAARTGQTLLASARPISLKANTQTFPAEFTVFTASTAEQISSSSNELKHGIFSYYLMRGMEGDADANKDGKITAGEMHTYLSENVAKQASLANRVQNPQLAGDANRVLVGK